MEGRIRSLFLIRDAALVIIMTFMSCVTVYAAENKTTEPPQVIEPEIDRREIDISKIDTEDFEVGVFAGMMSVEDFGVNPVYGVRLAYHATEDFFLEAAAGMTTTDQTSFELLSGGAPLLTDDQRDLTYYNVSIGYNVFHGEAFIGAKRAHNTALYLIAGIGSTEFAGDSRFTVNVGAGYRFLFNDSMTFHLDVRDHIFDIDIIGINKTTNNIEATAGFTVFF